MWWRRKKSQPQVAVNERHGWSRVDWDRFMEIGDVQLAWREVLETREQWMPQTGGAWWRAMRPRSGVRWCEIALEWQQMGEAAHAQNPHFKRWMTASAIVYEEEIPTCLYLFDEFTVEMVMRYMAGMRMQRIQWESFQNWKPYLQLPVPLNRMTDWLVNRKKSWASQMLSPGPANSQLLFGYVNQSWQVDKMPGELSLARLRKGITAVRLGLDMPVPYETAYIDVEVSDWVHRVGEWESKAPVAIQIHPSAAAEDGS